MRAVSATAREVSGWGGASLVAFTWNVRACLSRHRCVPRALVRVGRGSVRMDKLDGGGRRVNPRVVRGRWYVLSVALTLVACDPASRLVVQVRTDFVPVRELGSVRVTLSGADAVGWQQEVSARPEQRWGAGVRVAERELSAGIYRLQVTALDASGSVLVDRGVRAELRGGVQVVTVLLTRDCVGVTCPSSTSDPLAVTCLGGRCVPEDCIEESVADCDPVCVDSADCAPTSDCAQAECTPSGTCFASPEHDRCDPGEACSVAEGCVQVVSTELDAGGMDAGVLDAGALDAGMMDDSAVDAGMLDAGAVDAGVEILDGCGIEIAPRRWQVPVRIGELSDDVAREDDPSLSVDELEIFYNSNLAGDPDIWTARRASLSAPWTDARRVDELSSSAAEGTPSLTSNGLELYFSRGEYGSRDIYRSTRASPGAPWGEPVRVGELSRAGEDDASPALSPDQDVLILTRVVRGLDSDLFQSVRGMDGRWSAPVRLVELSTPEIEGDAMMITANEVYFSSQRCAERQLFVARRPSISTPFRPPAILVTGDGVPVAGEDIWLNAAGDRAVISDGYDLFLLRR